MQRIVLAGAVACCCVLGSPAQCLAAEHAPPLMLAQSYDLDDSIDIPHYWISEKLDGVRAYWDGERLITRGGHTIAAPDWFTAGWPPTPMDGELWGGRGTFERTSGTVRSQMPDATAWRMLTYRAFDLPDERTAFDQRLSKLQSIISAAGHPTLMAVDQRRVRDVSDLVALLKQVESQGGEGLMLHRSDSLYIAARTDELLKFKSFADAEATVIEYVAGQGKFAGMMGALVVERDDGVRFKIGSGFSDAQRRAPPSIGTRITYAFNGLTTNGLPRFARFVRVRDER